MAVTKQFEAATPPADGIRFTVGSDPYEYRPLSVLPAQYMIDLLWSPETNRRAMQASIEFLDRVLPPEDAEHFAGRMSDKDNAITTRQVQEVVNWLVEVYTGRPTEAPSPEQGGPAPTSDS